MLQTPIGKLKILLNDCEVGFNKKALLTEAKSFIVDKRVQIQFAIDMQLNKGNILKYILVDNADLEIKTCIETGEGLQLLSFYYQKFKLSIGIEEIRSVGYTYLENGMQLDINGPIMLSELNTIVAWREMQNVELEDTFTWYAADPTLH